jgi:hypothetical protein
MTYSLSTEKLVSKFAFLKRNLQRYTAAPSTAFPQEPPKSQTSSQSAASKSASQSASKSASKSKKTEEAEELLEPLSQPGAVGGWSASQRQRMAASFIYAVLIRDTEACLALVTSGGLTDIHVGLP